MSLVRDRRTSLLLGPYDTHAQALDQRDRGRTLAYEADAWSWFDPVGTVRLNPEADLPRSVFGT